MSVNTAHANNGVLIHAGETILLFSDNVSMEYSGQDNTMFKGIKQGRIYLTTHRVIFNNKNSKDPLQSFSSPFISMSDVELEQPVFGANYIRGKIRAQPNGNWTGEVKIKISFKSGGCIDFGQALLRAASMAQRNGGGMAPPPYTPPTNGWYEAPPPAYTPGAGSYGWLPQNSNFGTAPTSGVFMQDNPPPYPGINANYTPNYPTNGFTAPTGFVAPGAPGSYPNAPTGSYPNAPTGSYPNAPTGSYPNAPTGSYPNAPTGSYSQGPGPSYPTLPPNGFPGASAPTSMTKEQESAASAYYDPRAPNSAFVQQPQFYENPPAYSELDHKKQQ